MSTDCKACENQKWKEHYLLAQKRFDKVLVGLTIGFVIMFTVMILCLFVTACMVIRTQKFINEFEYVEETEIQIEQDCNGHNVVMLPNGDEVKTDGIKVHGEEEKILEKESNKNNVISIAK